MSTNSRRKSMGQGWLLSNLGEGTLAVSNLWENVKTGRKIVIKTLTKNSENRKHFGTTLRSMKRVDHLNVVPTCKIPSDLKSLLSLGLEPDIPILSNYFSNSILALEYCEGGNVQRLLEKPENLRGLEEGLVRTFLAQVTDAILYLHDTLNLIHGAIKPSNILMTYAQGDRSKVIFKLSEVGIPVKPCTEATPSYSLDYLAPEILMDQKYAKSVDYWSFGVVAYQVSSGQLPYSNCPDSGKGIIQVNTEIPSDTQLTGLLRRQVSTWLRSMLELCPIKRGKVFEDTAPRKDQGNSSCDALFILKDLLGRKYLKIHTEMGPQLYEITTQTKINDIQTYLAADLDIPLKNQMILTQDGCVVQNCVLAMKYLMPPKAPPTLYLLRKAYKPIDETVRVSAIIGDFVKEFKLNLSLSTRRTLWRAGIYEVQRHLRRTSTLFRASVTLRKFMEKATHNASNVSARELKDSEALVKGTYVRLLSLLEMEEKMVEVEQEELSKNLESIRTIAEGLIEKSMTCFDPADNDGSTHVNIDWLNQIYKDILKEYGTWRRNNFPHECIARFRILLCQFLMDERTLLSHLSLSFRASYGFLRRDEKLQRLDKVSEELLKLTDQLMAGRLSKQRQLLQIGDSIQNLSISESS